MALRSRSRAAARSTDPADELAAAIGAAGCGVCGQTVFPGQGKRLAESWAGNHRFIPGWAIHDGVCQRIAHTLSPHPGRPARAQGHLALAHLVDPAARPVVVDRAVIEVAEGRGVPVLFKDVDGNTPDHRGHREPWGHVPQAERRKLAEAVDARRAEMALGPAPHPSGWPCSVCGASHEVADRWGEHQGRPACAGCSKMVATSKISGNSPLEHMARSAAWDHIPPGRVVDPFPLASQMPGYARLAEGERRQPWDYVRDLPRVPPSPEERLAELEARLVGAP